MERLDASGLSFHTYLEIILSIILGAPLAIHHIWKRRPETKLLGWHRSVWVGRWPQEQPLQVSGFGGYDGVRKS